ncbi:type II toxin-antitoxin system HipA family toxin [Chromohalobacter sp. 48-RD10]|uniref:type II toxin-antitoxin system HipA family toxin n=1 Tax=Chromohalobacter sp. 48-RD10 TaxID=2994063 RepID=UPI002469888A|nr:type II toxin-antitoxin system HipA family toxin [Chromohalobacter sp. 48-RD10]
MTTSNDRAYVWVWLPGQTEPVAAGLLQHEQGGYRFLYGRRYLERDDAISLFPDELPLRRGAQRLAGGTLPSVLRDAAPDAWGRRVIINRLTGRSGADADLVTLDDLTFMLESGSDRIGALDFQASAEHYESRGELGASLEDLMEAAESVDRGKPLPTALAQALQHGTSIGGARPKALIGDNARKQVAKFSASNDLYSVVKTEFVAMRLAHLAGLDVANVELRYVMGRDVLLVERFDRRLSRQGWLRYAMVSALTLLGLDEMTARYASYEDLAHQVRARFTEPRATLHELFKRMVFNVLCGNTDDHARNHAAFWDGKTFTLTPAYDICPQSRVGGIASQAMRLVSDDNSSQLRTCLAAAPAFHLETGQARELIDRMIQTLESQWDAVCDDAQLPFVDRQYLWGRQFLNPFSLEGY